MPLIKPLIREKRAPLHVQLDEPVFKRFTEYCEFLGGDSTPSYVAQKMIERVLDSDRDFSAHLTTRGQVNGKVKPVRRPKVEEKEQK